MPKQLDQFFEDDDEEPEVEKQVPRAKGRIDNDYLSRRTAMFISMTQGRGKPMTFGAQKKDKK